MHGSKLALASTALGVAPAVTAAATRRSSLMTGQIYSVPEAARPLLGDPHPLLEQLGAAAPPDSSALGVSAGSLAQIRSLPALRSFLDAYRQELMLPVEFPAIVRARAHAVRQEVRELIALDTSLAAEPRLRELAAASCRVGQRQLNRLRPLRDQRLVQRYLAAIEQGQAHGWHLLVYGISLGVFSLPLRQGLTAYAWHTLGAFIDRSAGPLALTTTQCRDLQTRACAPVSQAVQQLLDDLQVATLRVL